MDLLESTSLKINGNKSADLRVLLLICLVACFPVYWAAFFYLQSVTGGDTEVLATATTIAFFSFFYIGWYFTEAWISIKESSVNKLLTFLAAAVVFCFVFLFVHADIQLQHKPAINLLLFWAPFIVLGTSLGMLTKLFLKKTRLKLANANALAAQSRSELHLLQSQMSPHFLFNTLNNMYGLSIAEHEKIPGLLLKLADLLRYSVYEAKELLVPLKSELAYITNYIDFEKIRIGSRLELQCEIEFIGTEDIKIAPMLLIVFIENAFKHAKNTTEKKIFIDISLKTWNGVILFAVKNSYEKHLKVTSDKNSGLGLTNAKKRLQALYYNQHILKLEEMDSFYSVALQLKIK
jgi:sensor histidine kinase YesM